MVEIAIAFAKPLPGNHKEDLKILLGQAFSEDVHVREQFLLAGPNENLQLVFDSIAWGYMASFAAGAFFNGFFSKLGNQVNELFVSKMQKVLGAKKLEKSDLARRVSELTLRLCEDTIPGFQSSGRTVVLSFPKVRHDSSRGVGIELPLFSEIKLADRLILMAQAASALESISEAVGANQNGIASGVLTSEQNADCSGAIRIYPDGTAICIARDNGGVSQVVLYDPISKKTVVTKKLDA